MRLLPILLIASVLLIAGCGKAESPGTALPTAAENVDLEKEASGLDAELQEADLQEQELNSSELDSIEADLGRI